jgi:hypothetical protein
MLTFTWKTHALTSPGDHTITATAASVSGETDTADNSGATTVTVTGTGDANDMYVWDQTWVDQKVRGKINLHVTVDVNQDSDADAVAEGTDEAVAGAYVAFRLIHDTDKDGFFEDGVGWPLSDDRIWLGDGYTAEDGSIVFDANDVPRGDYRGDVYGLVLEDLNWNSALDADNPSYYYRVPGGSEVSAFQMASGEATGSPNAVSQALAAFYTSEQTHSGHQPLKDSIIGALPTYFSTLGPEPAALAIQSDSERTFAAVVRTEAGPIWRFAVGRLEPDGTVEDDGGKPLTGASVDHSATDLFFFDLGLNSEEDPLVIQAADELARMLVE